MRIILAQLTLKRFLGLSGSAALLWILDGCASRESISLPPMTEVPALGSTFGRYAVGTTNPITVERAVERAGVCNAQLRALDAAVQVAKQRRSAASDIEDPEALATWGNTADELGDGFNDRREQNEWRVGGRVYVPNPFLISPRVSARTAEWMAAKADWQAARWQLECDVRRCYAELNYLAQDLDLAADIARDQAEILKDAQLRVAQAAGTGADVVAAAQKQLATESELDAIRHRYQMARRNLAGLLDLPVGALQIVTNTLRIPLPGGAAFAADSLQLTALQTRADVAALRWRTLAARYAYREARNARIPWFKEISAGDREPSQQWWVGVGVTVPIFSWTKNHTENVLEAQSKLAAENEATGAKLICQQLRDALDEVDERGRVQIRQQTQVAPLISEMRRTLQVLQSTPTVVAAQRLATEAQVLEGARLDLAARWQSELALLNLERALGKPLAEVLGVPQGKT